MTTAARSRLVRRARLVQPGRLARLVRLARLARRTRCGSDRGYATIASAGIIAAVVALALVVAALVGRVADTHRAQVAADLAAVAGATAVYAGSDACSTARQTAELNGAELVRCAITGADVVVSATVGKSEAVAKAGPI